MAILNNKKAETDALAVTVGIILLVLVLIFVIWWFTSSGGTLTEKIANLGGGKINVDTVKLACQNACDTNQEYQYKSVQRSVVFEDKGKAIKLTCKQLETAKVPGCYNSTLDTPAGNTTEKLCTAGTWTNTGWSQLTSCDKFS